MGTWPALTGLSDAYGSGSLQVYALNIDGARRDAIVTAIIKAPPGFAGADNIRVSLALSWRLVGDEWRLASVMDNYVLGPEFLDPSPDVKAGLFRNWQRYNP